jgi:hypothetical protein
MADEAVPASSAQQRSRRHRTGRRRLNPLGIAFSASCSSVTWGAADFAAGLVTRTLGAYMTVALTQTVGLAGAAALVVPTRRAGAPALRHWPGAGGGVVGLVGAGAFYRVLADGRMSIGSPLVAVIGAGLPVLVALLFGERLPPSDLAGIVPWTHRGGARVHARSIQATRSRAPRPSVAGIGHPGWRRRPASSCSSIGRRLSVLARGGSSSARFMTVGILAIGILATRTGPTGDQRTLAAARRDRPRRSARQRLLPLLECPGRALGRRRALVALSRDDVVPPASCSTNDCVVAS